jgi:Spy/CpxP family protein refolding chaperone
MKAIRRLTILGLLAVLATTVPVLAQGPAGDMPPPPPPGGPGGHGGPPNPAIGPAGRALHELDLSGEQREQIRDIVHGYMEGDLGQQLQAFHEARRALELLLWDSTAGEQDLIAASEVVAGAAQQMELVRHLLALDVLEVLTEEQRETFRQLLEVEPPHPGGPGGHGGPGGFEGRRGPGPRGR